MYNLKPSIFLALAAAVITASTAPTDAACGKDVPCDPTVNCGDISWTCNPDTITTAAPGAQSAPPREDNYCCDYFGTCGKSTTVSGKVSKRSINVETATGQVHKTDWLDLYIDTGEHVGSWISYIDNVPKLPDSLYNITDYYSEPEEACNGTNNTHKYPGWYHVALACVESAIDVTGLSIGANTIVPCPTDFTFACTGDTCNTTTNLAGIPDGTIPAKGIEIKCHHELGDEMMKITEASSVLLADFDGRSPNEALTLLYGWVPVLNDKDLYVKVTFMNPTFVVGVKTGGLTQDVERRVDSFTVSYEEYNWETKAITPLSENKVYYAGARLDTWVTNYFPDLIRAVSVTINVKTPINATNVGMRLRFLGCKVCERSSDCEADGRCKLDKMCDYTPIPDQVSAPVDPEIVNAGLEILKANNISDEEVDTFTALLGQGGGSSNTSTPKIDPKLVSAEVAEAVVSALILQSAGKGNDSNPQNVSNENVATAIDKVGGLIDALGDKDAALLTNLNTPAAVAKAEAVVGSVVNLVNELLDPENSGAWDLFGSKTVEVPDGVTTAKPADAGAKPVDAAANEAKEAEKKQQAMSKTAVNMMTGISTMTSALVSSPNAGGGPLIIKTDNLEAVAEKKDPAEVIKGGYELETDSEKLDASVNVPASSFASFPGEVKNVTITTVVLDATVLIAASRAAKEKAVAAGDGQLQEELASSLLSFECNVNGKGYKLPLDFNLGHRKPEVDEFGEPIEKTRCVFHDTTKPGFAVSSKGMNVKGANNNNTECKASHTTTFAVMMYLDNIDELGKHLKIQSKLTMFCGTLSVMFIAFAVAVFSYLRTTLMSERIMIHVILMVVTGMAMLTFMLGADRTENELVCKIVTVVIHFLYTAMFAWMLNEGIHLYRQIITVFETGKSRFWIYHVLGWGIPVCVVGISAGMQWNKYGKESVCFLAFDDGTLWAFIGPIIPVVLINFVVLFRVTQIVVGASKLDGDGGTVNSVKAGVRSSLLLLPLLGMTWVVGYFQHLHISLSYVFVILNALQGFFMAIFHCFLNSEVREGLKGAFKKLKANSVGGDSSIAEFTNKKSLISTMTTATTTDGKGNKVSPMSPYDD